MEASKAGRPATPTRLEEPLATDVILSLRPTDGTAAAIAAAIGRARQALLEAGASELQAQGARDELLIDGTPTQLKTAEAALATARDVADRVRAILPQLERRLIAAQQTEALAAAETAKRAAEAAGQLLANWWAKHQGTLVAILREGERLTTANTDALFDWSQAAARASKAVPDAIIPNVKMTSAPAESWRNKVTEMMEPVFMPIVHAPDPLAAERAERERLATEEYARTHNWHTPGAPANAPFSESAYLMGAEGGARL